MGRDRSKSVDDRTLDEMDTFDFDDVLGALRAEVRRLESVARPPAPRFSIARVLILLGLFFVAVPAIAALVMVVLSYFSR